MWFLLSKTKEETADMNNYRGISVSSVVSKVMETVLMERVRRVLRRVISSSVLNADTAVLTVPSR